VDDEEDVGAMAEVEASPYANVDMHHPRPDAAAALEHMLDEDQEENEAPFFDEVHTPSEGMHTPNEEAEDPMRSHRQHIGRFGAVNLMTPIAERTLEFTASMARSVANTPSRRAAARESQQFAMYMAGKPGAEIREEDEDADEEAPKIAATLWPTRGAGAADGIEHAPVIPERVEEEKEPSENGDGIPNPCNPFEKEIMDFALQDLHAVPTFHDLSDQDGDHLDNLQKFAKRNEAHARFTLVLAGHKFVVSRKLGEGGFGAVFSALDRGPVDPDADSDEDSDDDDGAEDNVALKVVRPRSRWEFHMIRQIHAALPAHLRASIIAPHELFLFRDESILVLDLRTQGTLLELVNKAGALGLARPGQPLDEAVAMFFAVELLRALEGLHRAGIIHGDLKIDNCLVRLGAVPGGPAAWAAQYAADGAGGWAHKGVALIDFGRAVDTRLFAPGQTFVGDWPADARDCPEQRAGAPWTFEADYFGLAGIAYCLLFGKYIDAGAVVQQPDGRYRLASAIKRYWQAELWTALFDALLNPKAVRADGSLPLCDELGALRADMEAWLTKNCERAGQASLKQSLKRIERGEL
jgi:checkpoint serine/threonine-protein kinase